MGYSRIAGRLAGSSPELMEMAKKLVVLQEQERLLRWGAALDSGFEAVPGDGRFCVRRSEVVDHVAKVLGIQVVNNVLFAQVVRVARSKGWEPVKNGGRSLFRRVKRRRMSEEDALALSRANRRDPRYPGCSERGRPVPPSM